MKEDKSDQAARCIKSRIITNMIDFVLSIVTFEQKFVLIEGMLKSLRLKDHVQTIGIDPSLSNNSLYEHKFIENIKKYTKNLVSLTTSNNSKILLSLICFLLLKNSQQRSYISQDINTSQETKCSKITVYVY